MPDIFYSKKFQAGFITALAIFLGQLFPTWSETGDFIMALARINWIEVTGPIMVAIGAQGVADWGKEKAKVEAAIREMEQEQEAKD